MRKPYWIAILMAAIALSVVWGTSYLLTAADTPKWTHFPVLITGILIFCIAAIVGIVVLVNSEE